MLEKLKWCDTNFIEIIVEYPFSVVSKIFVNLVMRQ